MDSLLPIINKLQDVFTTVGVSPLQLPQLVVVGSQSCGKSSVLENIVGKDFLPRGHTIVTRRPLILQLVNNSDGRFALEDGKGDEWGEFLHRQNERFYKFRQICDEIARETNRVAGNHGVSASPIRLTIYSPRILNLSLVDLPGLTKVAVGDQPSDIEEQIRAIVIKYASNPNSIIVAVSPANQDIANSDALKLAREVDPFGKRTLGVLTKLDLMDRGTDALPVLTGKVIPLQLGFVGTVNRSQDDINRGVSIRTALENERVYFKNHPVYRSIASRLGTSYLAERLNLTLLSHIKSCLPEIKTKISAQIAQTEKELRSYGEVMGADDSKGAHLLNLLSKFRNSYCDALDGKSPDVSLEELYGGARISYVFHEIFAKAVDRCDPFDTLSDRDIRTAIRNVTGPRPALFVPEVSFELIVKKQIARLLQPSLECVDLVFDELQRVALQCEMSVVELSRFPHLRAKVIETVRALLRRRIEPTKSMITNVINVELAYINTSHPDFIGGSGAVASLVNHKRNTRASGNHTNSNSNNNGSGSNNNNQNSSPNDDHQRSRQVSDDFDDVHEISRDRSPQALPTSNKRRSKHRSSYSRSARSDGLFSMIFGDRKKNVQNDEELSANNNHHEHDDDKSGDDSSSGADESLVVPRSSMTAMHKSRSGHLGGREARGDEVTMKEVPNRMVAPEPSEREKIETEIIKSLVSSYFEIVKKNIQDHVPKTVMYSLVNQSKADIQSELIHTLYVPQNYDELLKEAEEIAHQRSSCEQLLQILAQALDIVNEVRDFTLST